MPAVSNSVGSSPKNSAQKISCQFFTSTLARSVQRLVIQLRRDVKRGGIMDARPASGEDRVGAAVSCNDQLGRSAHARENLRCTNLSSQGRIERSGLSEH